MNATALHPGWTVQLAIHRAARRDITRLSDSLARGDAALPPGLLAYWSETARQLHHHHVLEDSVIWPCLAERLGTRVAALLARNANEHLAMSDAMDAFDALVADPVNLPRARLALRRLADAVDRHLDHEERDVLPLIPEAFTPEDIALFSAESGRTNPPDRFLPWVLDDATGADVEVFTGTMPEPMRRTLETRWMPAWRATADALASPSHRSRSAGPRAES
jgi:hypothetical protein